MKQILIENILTVKTPPIMAQRFVMKCEKDFGFSVIIICKEKNRATNGVIIKRRVSILRNLREILTEPAWERAHSGTLQRVSSKSELCCCEQCIHIPRSMNVLDQFLL